jgi:hypothetical protein
LYDFSEKLTRFWMRQKAEVWQTYIEGQPKPKGKLGNPETFAPQGGGLKWTMENAMFLNILASMGKTRNTIYKKGPCKYGDDSCEERQYALVNVSVHRI